MNALLTSAKTVAFIVTQDRERARRFYGGTLGFSVISEDDFALVFDMKRRDAAGIHGEGS